MMADKQVKTRIGYEIDRSSVQQVIIGNQAIRQSVEGVKDVLGEVSPATAAATNMLMTRFKYAGTEVEDVAAEVEQLRAELLALDDVQVEPDIRLPDVPNQTAQRNRQSNQRGGVDTVDRLGSIGSQIFSGLGQGELANVAGLVGDVAGAAGALGPLGIAAAALAPVIGLVTTEINKNTEAERARATALRTVADAIVNGTRAEIESKIAALQSDNAVSEELIRLIEERTGKTREYFQSLTQTDVSDFGLVGGLANLSAKLQGLGGDAGVINDANKSIESNAFLIEALTGVLTGNATATNDAADAERRLLDARAQAVADDFNALQQADRMTAAQREQQIANNTRQIQLLQQQGDALAAQGLSTDAVNESINRLAQENAVLESVTWSLTDAQSAQAEASRRSLYATDAAFRADQMTAEERAGRIEQIQNELDVYNQLIERGHLSAEATEQVKTQIANLTIEQIELGEVTESTADKLAAQAAAQKALSDQTDNYLDALEDIGKAEESVFEARTKLTETIAEGAAKQQELLSETEEKRGEILDASQEKLADIEQKGSKEREKILRDFNRSYTRSVGERDALAGKQAQEASSDRLNDLREGYNDQLAEQKKQLDKQLAQVDRAYSQQYQRISSALAQEVSTRQQALNRAQIDLLNSQNYQQAIAMNGAGNQRKIHEYMWGALDQAAIAGASKLVNSFRSVMNSYSGGSYVGTSLGGQSPVNITYNQIAPAPNAVTTNQLKTIIQTAARSSGSGGGGAYL